MSLINQIVGQHSLSKNFKNYWRSQASGLIKAVPITSNICAVSRDPPATLLDAQDDERSQLLAQVRQAKAKDSLHDIWQAETKADAEEAFDLFIKMYEPKYPKAAICLQKDRDEMMAFYDFPAQHWQSIRTSNPIESTFGTIRHRTRRSKGCLSRDGMLHMMFKLGQCAEKKWKRLRGFDYLTKVIAGVKFKDGVEVTEVDLVAA